jgi:hypothetical protein
MQLLLTRKQNFLLVIIEFIFFPISHRPLTPQQKQQQVVAQIRELLQLAEKIDAVAKTPEKTTLNKTAQSVAAQVELLYKAVRMAAGSGIDPQGKLIPGAKGVKFFQHVEEKKKFFSRETKFFFFFLDSKS